MNSNLIAAQIELQAAYVSVRRAAEALNGPSRARADEIAARIGVAVVNVDFLAFLTDERA